MPKRPLLQRQPPGLEHVFNMLAEELATWPGVKMRPMFGLRAFYRGDRIFAMLPHRRSLERTNAFGYKLGGGEESKEGRRWRLFDLDDPAHIGAAVERLAIAFEGRADSIGTAATRL